MVNSTVDFNMVSTRKKKQQNRRFLRQLTESHPDIMIKQSNHDAQNERRASVGDGDTSFNGTNDPTQVNGSQVDTRTLEKKLLVEYEVKWIV